MPLGLTAPTISLWAFSMSAVLLQKKIPSLPTPPAGLATTGHLLRFVAHSRSSSTLPDLICSAAGTPHFHKQPQRRPPSTICCPPLLPGSAL